MKKTSDSFGARFYLAVYALNGLGGKAKAYYDKKNGESIGDLFFALESFASNDYVEARKFFKKALNNTWVYIELFEGKIPERNNFIISSNRDTPALSQEIDFSWPVTGKTTLKQKVFLVRFFEKKTLKSS